MSSKTARFLLDQNLAHGLTAGLWAIRSKRSLHELLLALPQDAHKGIFGHVLTLSGHDRYLGASRLCAYGALRAGAGLVSLLGNHNQNNCHPHDRFEFMKFTFEDLPDLLKRIDCLVIGPGLSTESAALDYAKEVIKIAKGQIKTIVLDADALKLLEDEPAIFAVDQLICTPHPKEAASLLGLSTKTVQKDRVKAIEQLFATFNASIPASCTWVLKGANTLVCASNGEKFVFDGDFPILSTGGNGDVLAGVIAGLITQCDSPLAACLVAVSLQLEAAAVFQKSAMRGIFPTEIADQFPYLLGTKRS